MTNTEFEAHYPRYKAVITAIARKFASSEADLFDDLVAVGMQGLLAADITRAAKNKDAYIRNAIRNRMVDHMRWLDPERFERLDRHLAQGAQVVKDPETSDIILIRPDAKRETRNIDRTAGHAGFRRGQGIGYGVNPEDDYDG